jgi:hypothetical protein
MIFLGEWFARIGIMSMTLGFVTWMLLTYNPENLELWKKLTPLLFFGGFAVTIIGIMLLGGV